MVLTYQYRLLPSKNQHRALESLLESQRLLYNAALEERIGAYRVGVSVSYIDQTKSLTEWRQSDPEAAAIPVSLQRATLRRIDSAYKKFYQRVQRKAAKPGFPRFRGKGWWHSFGFSQFDGITFDGRKLRRDTKGWKVGFGVDIGDAPIRRGNRVVGVDLGLETFATLSDGGFIPSLRVGRRAQRRLRVAQRALARKHRGSHSRAKARTKVARCHTATAGVRAEYLHQAASRLVREYDVIAIEDLNVRPMARSKLARAVHDAS